MFKPLWKSGLAATLTLSSVLSLSAQDPTPLVTRNQDQLLAVLKSDAELKAKADACRELAVIGNQQAIPALVALLPDEKLSHMARYALETMRDPAVDTALREALSTLKGRPLVGVIVSLGVRRDAQAIDRLTAFLDSADPMIAQAAARALGSIGTPAAGQILLSAAASASEQNLLALAEGLGRCAERLLAEGRRDEALAIYDHFDEPNLPHQVRAGALRGAILARGKDGLPVLAEALRSSDYILTAAAARAALELKDPGVTKTLVAELPQLNPDKQVLVISTLGKRGDPAALPALVTATKNSNPAVRLAAVRALPELGDKAALAPLAELMQDNNKEVAQTAQEGLASLPGKAVDDWVLGQLAGQQTAQRLAALELISRRRMTGSIPALLKAAEDPDAQVRPAALRRLGELAEAPQVPALLDLFMRAKTGGDIGAAEQAISAVCLRAEKPEAQASRLVALLPKAQPSHKTPLLGLLATVGGPDALKAVRSAVADSNPEVRSAALRALGSWKTADAAPELLALAKAASTPSERMLCLRSYLAWASNAELPAPQRLTMCQQASSVVQQPDEKKLLLGALGSLKTPESLALIAPHLDNAATKEEAAAAVVAVASELVKTDDAAAAGRLVDPLKKAATASNADLAKRAQNLLDQAQKKAGTK